MAQYIIRKGRLRYEVAKFDDSSTPLDIYSISDRWCNCPARSRICKHTRMVKAWQNNGSLLGEVYDDNLNVIGNIFN